MSKYIYICGDEKVIFNKLPNQFKNMNGLQYADEKFLNENSLFELIEPIINVHQKYGELVRDENKYTYEVVEMSQEEIEAHNQQLQLQVIEAYKTKWKADGEVYYSDMQNRIIMMLVGKVNAVSLMLEIKKTINPMLEQIQRGNQSIAILDYIDGENNPTIKEVIELFNEIGQYCISYYQTEYPH